MPKYRRKKNQPRNKGKHNNNNKGSNNRKQIQLSSSVLQKDQEDQELPGGEKLIVDEKFVVGKSNEITISTGINPEIEEKNTIDVDNKKVKEIECMQIIDVDVNAGSSKSKESKIVLVTDKSHTTDCGEVAISLEVEELFQDNSVQFSDICPVTNTLNNNVIGCDNAIKTGGKNSTEQKKVEIPSVVHQSPPTPRELLEIRKKDRLQQEKVEDSENEDTEKTIINTNLHSSPTSSSLSSESDTLKGDEDSPEREMVNVLEIDSHDMHDVTNETTPKETKCISVTVQDIQEPSSEADTNKDIGIYRNSKESKNATSSSSLEGFDEPDNLNRKKPIKHPIVQEVITTFYSYRVESPKPMPSKAIKMTTIKKSRSLDDDDVTIQEITDNSSSGDLTDNQPLVSEVDSEAENSETAENLAIAEKSDSRILSVTTFSLDSPEAKSIETQEFRTTATITTNIEDEEKSTANESSQDFKSRRAKKRVALETHFMPQFLNPRYLDSIKEECSDHSDLEKKSDSEIPSHPNSPTLKNYNDDNDEMIIPESPTATKRANAIFPKSNLDFSHKHKPVSHLRAPKAGVIREEQPCIIVEAKIVEHDPMEESCSTWTTDKIQESGAAEIVYLDSASSSSSDLMDLDYAQGNEADIEDLIEDTDVHIQTPTIEMDLNENNIFTNTQTDHSVSVYEGQQQHHQQQHEKYDQQKYQQSHQQKEKQNTISEFNNKENISSTPPTLPQVPNSLPTPIESSPSSSSSSTHAIYENEKQTEQNISADEILIIENSTEGGCDHRQIYEKQKNASGNEEEIDHVIVNKGPSSSSSENNFAVEVLSGKNLKEQNSVDSEKYNSNNCECNPLKIISNIEGEKSCSNSEMFASLLSPLISSDKDETSTIQNPNETKITTMTTTVTTKINGNVKDKNDDISEDQDINLTNSSCSNTNKELTRQDSAGSYASAQSQSTVHSQCTAINKDSLAYSDVADFADISGSSIADDGINTETTAVKTLRQLCIEVLAFMPYGKDILEELASVAQSLSHLTEQHQKLERSKQLLKESDEMPYPLPELPRIHDLEIPKMENKTSRLSHVKLMAVPPSPKLPSKSPVPPPVPELPKEQSWLGVPSEQDPKVLLCLSPSQRNYLKETKTFTDRNSADNLLDMHKKFVERRGYHELTTEQVNAMQRNNEQVVSSTQLRNSVTPPPIPPPPLPEAFIENETEATTENSIKTYRHLVDGICNTSTSGKGSGGNDDDGDKNNHRLLAIIRDSKQSSSSENNSTSRKIEQAAEKSSKINEASVSAVGKTSTQQFSGDYQKEKEEKIEIIKNSTTSTTTVTQENKEIGKKVNEKLLSGPEKLPLQSSVKGENYQKQENQNEDKKMTQTSFFKSYLEKENPFKEEFKRFSTIETTPTYCGQIMQTIPKRYSNIETSSFESRKRIENGKLVYDFCDSNKQKFTDDSSGNFTDNSKASEKISGGLNVGDNRNTDNTDRIMSDIKLESIFPSILKEAPTVNTAFEINHEKNKTTTTSSNEFSQIYKNSKTDNEKSTFTKDFSYDEFRQRAKEAAKNAKSEFFKRETLLKDFEDIEKEFHDDLFSMTPSKTVTSENMKTKKDESKIYEIPVNIEKTETSSKKSTNMWDELDKKILQKESKKEENQETKFYENVKTSTEQKKQKEYKKAATAPISYEIPIRIETKTDPWAEFEKLRRQHQHQMQQHNTPQSQTHVHEIPIKIEKSTDPWQKLDEKVESSKITTKTTSSTTSEKIRNVPIKIEDQKTTTTKADVIDGKEYNQTLPRPNSKKNTERTVPIKIEQRPRPASATHFEQYSSSVPNAYRHQHSYEQKLTEKRLSSHNLDEWMKYADLGASSENITKPFMKEMEIVYQGRRPNIRAPRLTASTNNLHTIGKFEDITHNSNIYRGSHYQQQSPGRRYMSCQSMIDQTPITQYVTPHFVRRSSLPKELYDKQIDYIKIKEKELQTEFDRLEEDRRKLIEEMDRMNSSHKLRKDLYQHRSCRLPTLSEDEAFRQQMHNEWMNKVAEREERRLHKIIKISKPSDELNSGVPEKPVRKSSSTIDISDEFLKRVKERRSKLQMPSDSDWESGAESQPISKNCIESDTETMCKVKVIEGQEVADLRQLPKHLREFAELTSKIEQQQQHQEENYEQKDLNKVNFHKSTKSSMIIKKDGELKDLKIFSILIAAATVAWTFWRIITNN